MNQKTEWGHISWLHAQKPNSLEQSFSVGITYLLPGKRLERHIHYGIDQFLYILEGEGIYIINDEVKEFRKGMFFYLEADTSHETINTGTKPVREFMVSHPVTYNNGIGLNEETIDKVENNSINFKNLIYSAVEAIRLQLVETISLPFTIYDDLWSIVIQNNKFSSYCNEKCSPLKNHDCSCLKYRDYSIDIDEGGQFICEYGLTIFDYPIIYNGRYLGTIRGGHVLISDHTTAVHEALYDSPQSTIIGIKSLLKQIVKSIYSYCAFNTSRQLLEAKDKELREVMCNNQILEKNLFTINDKVTNLRINHHFLFNTLNSLAGMSLTGDRYDLYNAIIDLSKMFRYTMTVDLKFVPLKSEIEYLETYLNLQRLRYGKDLDVQYSIEKEIDIILVPFNFLQPIVENAFIHGFSPSDDKKLLKIKVFRIDERARISIINNGVPLDCIALDRLNKSLISNTGHGLSLIYEKLKSAYSNNFRMNIISNFKKETGVIIEIPIIYEEAM